MPNGIIHKGPALVNQLHEPPPALPNRKPARGCGLCESVGACPDCAEHLAAELRRYVR